MSMEDFRSTFHHVGLFTLLGVVARSLQTIATKLIDQRTQRTKQLNDRKAAETKQLIEQTNFETWCRYNDLAQRYNPNHYAVLPTEGGYFQFGNPGQAPKSRGDKYDPVDPYAERKKPSPLKIVNRPKKTGTSPDNEV